jgi:hypothetical protein
MLLLNANACQTILEREAERRDTDNEIRAR